MRNINEIVTEKDTDRIHTLLTARKKPFKTSLQEIEAQYDPRQHKIFDEHYRPKKVIKVPTDKKDPTIGKTIYKNKKVERVRIAIPVQKSIVERAVGFLLGIPAEYRITQNGQKVKKVTNNQQRLFGAVQKVYHHNKMKYFDKRLARMVYRQREAAELWYMETNPDGTVKLDGKMRVKLLAPVLGG